MSNKPLFALVSLFIAATSQAQWSSNPATNLPVSPAPGDQVQPKLVRVSNGGGAYLSWFDGLANGYDVRLQRLGTNGKELLPAGGVLVADRSFSSTQDYGLDANFDGTALLAFRDDRFGGIQITAARIGVDGASIWGPNGVQLTQTSAFVAAPVIAKAFDQGAFVAWTQDTSVRVQRLNGAGVPQWAQDVVLTPAAGSFSVADMHSDPNADTAVLSIVHQTGGFGSPRRLLAQRIDDSGALMWGASHVAVFDTGSLQLGNFPDFAPDAGGGGIFSWYDAASAQLQCYAQHILGDGSEAFPHNGVAVSTDTTRVRVSPSASFDAVSGETTLVWREQSAGQSMNGVWAQRLDAVGNRLWTATGKALVPLGPDELTQVSLAPTIRRGAQVFWVRSIGFGQGRLEGSRLDHGGSVISGPFDVASTPSNKSRLAALGAFEGFAILAWTDDRNDEGDLLVQNVNSDGGLGRVGSESCFGVGCPCGNDDPSAGCANATGQGTYLAGVGTLSVAAGDFVLGATQAPANADCLLFMGDGALAPAPFGNGLRCVGGNTWRWSLSNTGFSGTSIYSDLTGLSQSNPVGFQLAPGTTWHFQLWYRDPSGPCGSSFNLSNAVTATFGP